VKPDKLVLINKISNQETRPGITGLWIRNDKYIIWKNRDIPASRIAREYYSRDVL
jgi:hypothetical protein